MEYINRSSGPKVSRPIRIIQFGEGNFLRAFTDYMIDVANESGVFNGDVVLVKPRNHGNLDAFKRQECQYTVLLKGIADNKAQIIKRKISCVADALNPYLEYEKYNDYAKIDTLRFVVSNTTEAGIVYDEADKFELCPPMSFPGKLTKFLFTRFTEFKGDMDKGLVMLPVELIDDNGLRLKECVLKQINNWKLPETFKNWVLDACVFSSTLVDRIVSGYPKNEAYELCREFGYKDDLLVTGELFALWVIESERDVSEEFPLHKAGLPVVFTDNHHPYKQRKVRILNGAHTSFALASFLCGNDFVLQSMEDETVYNYIRKTIYEEIIPTLPLPTEELTKFSEDVLERFKNPYVKHAHLSISLNSVSKWRTRCLPSLLEYAEKKGEVPNCLAFSLAALMSFYTGREIREKALIGHRFGEEYKIVDDLFVLEFFEKNSGKEALLFTHLTLSNVDFWGVNLCNVDGLEEKVASFVEQIRNNGMRKTMECLLA